MYKQNSIRYKNIEYNLDECKSLFDVIIVKRNYAKITDSPFLEYNGKRTGYIQIFKTELRKYVGNNIDFYLHAMQQANFIMSDGIYSNYDGNGKAYGYKINDKYFERDDYSGVLYRVELITNWRLKTKRFTEKINNRKNYINKYGNFYDMMISNVIKLIDEIDIDEVKQYYGDNVFEFYEINNPTEKGKRGAFNRLKKDDKFLYFNDFILYLRKLKEGFIYFNVKDEFGERFHSPFTNIKKQIRQFIKYEDVKYKELDIVNSQMSFFSLILTDWNITNVLTEFVDIIEELQIHQNLEHIKLFVKKSFNGELYEWISDFIQMDRSQTKLTMFKILFSRNKHFTHRKYRVSELLPMIIDICNHYNTNNDNLIPKLCQRFESRVMIHGVANEFTKQAKYPFYTVHDSFGYHPEDEETLKNIYNKTFNKLDITPLKLK